MHSINPNFVFCEYSTSGTLHLRARLLPPLRSSPRQRRDHPAWGQDVVECTAGRWQGPWGKGEGGGKKGEKIPKGPEGWEGGRARAGNRRYLQRCPRAAVGLALAALALEPAAPPGALGHPGTALAGAPRLAPSSRLRRRVVWGPAAKAGRDPRRVEGGRGSWCDPGGWRGPWRRAALREAQGLARARGAVCPRDGSRPWRGAPGAGWARRIAKTCGLATIAEPRGPRAQEGGIFFES